MEEGPSTGERDELLKERRDEEEVVRTTEDSEMKSPMRTVKDVLREAEGIMKERSDWREVKDKQEDVLVDTVDVEYSPQKHHLPIEIVVRHNKVVSTNRGDSSDSDDESRARRGGRKAQRDKRMQETELSNGSGKKGGKKPFTKGHRRAWSMPNAKGEQTHLAVINDDVQMADGVHHRRIVRYKLHPHKRPNRINEVNEEEQPRVRFEDLGEFGDEENELELEINEEEIVYPSHEGGKGRRTVVKRFWEARWKAQNFDLLPEWLQDNEYLRTGHRPPLPSFGSCFKSIFALHTETGNIWTHMYGCVLFVGVALWFLFRPSLLVQWEEKLVLSAFFFGAVCCLGLSFAFHTVQCHSPQVGSLFSKLDYTGISVLIMGSFVPWIHYGFYCKPACQVVYIGMIVLLGTMAIIVSLWEKFASPKFRPLRAGVFISMGLSSIVPAIHLLVVEGFRWMMDYASLAWLLTMGALYLTGATIYATRIPERWFPGKCDLWFQSHQLFHTFVVVAAFVHFNGICLTTQKILELGSCSEQFLERYGSETNPSWLGSHLGLDEPPSVISWNPSIKPPS